MAVVQMTGDRHEVLFSPLTLGARLLEGVARVLELGHAPVSPFDLGVRTDPVLTGADLVDVGAGASHEALTPTPDRHGVLEVRRRLRAEVQQVPAVAHEGPLVGPDHLQVAGHLLREDDGLLVVPMLGVVGFLGLDSLLNGQLAYSTSPMSPSST